MEIQWPLVFFTALMCTAAGLIAGLGALIAAGKGAKAYLPGAAVAFVAIVLGGLSSFMHLQHWERIFNGFGNPTSGITQELVAIVVAVVVLAVLFVMARKAEGGALPKWLGVVMVVVGVAMALVCAGSYMMPARPAWSNASMVLYFLASAFVLGTSALWCLLAFVGEEELAKGAGLVTLVAGLVAAIVTAAFAMVAQGATYNQVQSFFDPTTPTVEPVVGADAVNGVFSQNGMLLWGGGLVLGGIVPAVLGAAAKFAAGVPSKVLAPIAFVVAFVGAVCFRAVFYMLGVTVFAIF